MLFSELSRLLNGEVNISHDQELSGFYTDSRAAPGRSSDIFVALKGKRDGHAFIIDAINKGVKNFIVEQPISNADVNWVQVPNSLQAFQKVASYHRNRFNIPIVGITGSNGKTTVKEWLFTLLSNKYYTVKSPKSYNSQIGAPLSVLGLTSNHELGIFEAGISQIGEMQAIAEVINPTIGIFTTLGGAHDDGFSSREEKLVEKLKLFNNASKVICQSNTKWFDKLRQEIGNERLITWSSDPLTSHYHVTWSTGKIKVDDLVFRVNVVDNASLENITHCIITALTLNVSAGEIQEGLDQIKPVPMRLELKRGINGCYILDDTYNNDLEGLVVAINYLNGQRQNAKKTLILSDIIHSKEPAEKLYTTICKLLEENHFDRFIGVGKNLKAVSHLFPEGAIIYDHLDDLINNLPTFDQEMILIKGARDFQFERLVKRLEEKSHGTVLEVNFEALQHNLNTYKSQLQPNTKIMIMVKANAYGSGLLEVSNFLQHQHVDYLGVAYVDEAVALRKNGVTLPIMIMNPYIEQFEQFERFKLEPEIYSILQFDRFLKDVKDSVSVHIKIDTGMHRLGFSHDELNDLKARLIANPQVDVASIFTHFSASDAAMHDDFTRQQAKVFDTAYKLLSEAIEYNPIKHACNSAGIARWPDYHYDMVRLGIGLHGFDPTNSLNLQTVSKLKSIVSQIQILEAGETIGYSRNGIVKRNSKIAVIPIGYEDGFLRAFGNGKYHVRIGDGKYPTIGNTCMDMVMIDVTDSDVTEGDEVIVFENVDEVKQLSAAANTIPHEILTNISGRVKRVFVSE